MIQFFKNALKRRKKYPKYFVYISPEKVEMLFSQIPKKTLKSIGTELKFDLKLFSATFREEPTKQNLISKTLIVAEYLKKNRDITGYVEKEKKGNFDAKLSNLEETKSYIFGSVDLKTHILKDLQPPAILFDNECLVSETTKLIRIRIMMGGSLKNVIGYEYIVDGNHYDNYLNQSSVEGVYASIKHYFRQEINANFEYGVGTISTPSRNCEFLAKVFLDEQNTATLYSRVIIGSPVYVSYT